MTKQVCCPRCGRDCLMVALPRRGVSLLDPNPDDHGTVAVTDIGAFVELRPSACAPEGIILYRIHNC